MPEPRYTDGSLIVKWQTREIAREMVRQPHPLLEAVGGVVTWTSDIVPGLSIIERPRGGTEVAESVIRVLREAEYVERDGLGRGAAVPNDAEYASFQQTYMNLICAEGAWNVRTTATKPFSVLDSGVTYTKLDLATNVMLNTVEIPNNAKDEDANGYVDDYWGSEFLFPEAAPGTWPNPDDQHGHGMTVASVAAAVGNNNPSIPNNDDIAGVAWSCSMLPVKCFDQNDRGAWSGVLKALEYSYKRGVRIVNLSFTFFTNDSSAARQFVQNTPDVLYVVASGNGSIDLDLPCSTNMYPQEWPYANMLCVAACSPNDQPWYVPPPDPCIYWEGSSCVGTTTVDMFAPGDGIRVLNKNSQSNTTESGTSYAAPMVTATAALLWTQYPSYSVQDIKNKIIDSGDALPQYSGLCASGRRLNMRAALEAPSCQ
jgi:subtilisin family serine protease